MKAGPLPRTRPSPNGKNPGKNHKPASLLLKLQPNLNRIKPLKIKTENGATSAGAADARLEEARENLQTSRETEKRIASELEQLKKSGDASAEAIKDYEDYLSRVRAMTAENRKIVEQMEAAYRPAYPGRNQFRFGSFERAG